MAKLNMASVAEGLQQVLNAAQTLAPIAQQLGGPSVANAATVVIAGAAIAENILERIADGKVVANAKEEAVIREKLTALQSINDELAGAISKS